MSNKNLRQAKAAKNDEFYTQLSTIEEELQHYDFTDQVVYMNCDNVAWSNFWRYFNERFNELGVSEIIATHYVADGCSAVTRRTADSTITTPLEGDGDFRSAECVELLREADVVVTNPPFSLFREFVSLLVEHGKDFLVIGNMNAITYKEAFPSIKDNKLWLGRSRDTNTSSVWFTVPDDYPENKHERRTVEGVRIIPVVARWYTNLQHGRRHQPLKLASQAENLRSNKRIASNPNSYKRYDNYDAIEVPLVAGIPSDHIGVMGVPISYLDKHCPDQFKIVGFTNNPKINGVSLYKRLFIRRRSITATPVATELPLAA